MDKTQEWNMDKTQEAFKDIDPNIEIKETAWNSINDKWEGSSPRNTEHFITTATEYFNSLPVGTEVYLIGHSFGGDSILEFLNRYRRTNVKFRFVAVLDAVGWGGQRSLTRNNSVGSNVEYFFNRWQNNSPWPVDFRSSGNISCSAKVCDQKDQSISRHPDGSARKTKCRDDEVTCPGYRVDVSRGYPRIIAGEKQTRLHHSYVPTDPYIETQIIEKVSNLVASSDNSIPADVTSIHSISSGVIYGLTSSGDLYYYRHDSNLRWLSSSQKIGHGWNGYANVFTSLD